LQDRSDKLNKGSGKGAGEVHDRSLMG
jgi:hypothetical protein